MELQHQHQFTNKSDHHTAYSNVLYSNINDAPPGQMESASSSSLGFLPNKSYEQAHNLWGCSDLSTNSAFPTTPNLEELAVGRPWRNYKNTKDQLYEKDVHPLDHFPNYNDALLPQLDNLFLESSPASTGGQEFVPSESRLPLYSRRSKNFLSPVPETGTPTFGQLAIRTPWGNNKDTKDQPNEKGVYQLTLFPNYNDALQPQLDNIFLESAPASTGGQEFVPSESRLPLYSRRPKNFPSPVQEVGTLTFGELAVGISSPNKGSNTVQVVRSLQDTGPGMDKLPHSYQQLILKPNSSSRIESCMPIVEKMGQQCMGPCFGYFGPYPSEECEVYVRFIPKAVGENRIYPVFSRVGDIFEIRIPTNEPQSIRNCYVRYYTEVGADRAVTELSGFKFRGTQDSFAGIKVQKVASMTRLCINGLQSHLYSLGIYDLLTQSECGIGLESAQYHGNQENPGENGGYCFLEYKNHFFALDGWKWILQLQPLGPQATVNWALSKKVVELPEPIGTHALYNGTDLRQRLKSTSQESKSQHPPKYC